MNWMVVTKLFQVLAGLIIPRVGVPTRLVSYNSDGKKDRDGAEAYRLANGLQHQNRPGAG